MRMLAALSMAISILAAVAGCGDSGSPRRPAPQAGSAAAEESHVRFVHFTGNPPG